jgi:uncharacterized membrane protein (UPF0127 family)
VTRGRFARKTTGDVVLPLVDRADSLFERTRGLLGRPAPAPGEGLLLRRCGAIHTIGMRYAIDLVFLDRQERVVGLTPALAPFRFSWHRQAAATVELRAGEIARLGLVKGEQWVWESL